MLEWSCRHEEGHFLKNCKCWWQLMRDPWSKQSMAFASDTKSIRHGTRVRVISIFKGRYPTVKKGSNEWTYTQTHGRITSMNFPKLANDQFSLRTRSPCAWAWDASFCALVSFAGKIKQAAVTLELKKRAKQTKSVYIARTAVTWKLKSFHVTAVRAICLFSLLL